MSSWYSRAFKPEHVAERPRLVRDDWVDGGDIVRCVLAKEFMDFSNDDELQTGRGGRR